MSKKSAHFDVTGELRALRRYGLTLTRDAAQAEDLVHETLLRAYEKRGAFKSEKALRPWLLSILHNCFIDGIRRERANKLKLTRAAEMADSHTLPSQEHRVRLAQLRQTFMSLPEEQRAALHLVAMEDLSYQEAAATLGIPVGTLMSRLGRARAALRALEDHLESSAERQKPRPGHLKIVGGTDDCSD